VFGSDCSSYAPRIHKRNDKRKHKQVSRLGTTPHLAVDAIVGGGGNGPREEWSKENGRGEASISDALAPAPPKQPAPANTQPQRSPHPAPPHPTPKTPPHLIR